MKRLWGWQGLGIAVLLTAGVAGAQSYTSMRVLDHGTVQGMASQVDCTGTGVACTVNPTGVKWTLNANVPPATANTLGGIIPGQGLSMGGNYLNVTAASNTLLGGIKVGSGLSMSASNVLSTIGTGSPGGVAGDLQVNSGSGGFSPYAGGACSAGNYVSAINTPGNLTCSVPPGTYTLPAATNTLLGGLYFSSAYAPGGVIYSTNTALGVNVPGTAGQALKSGGSGAPVWDWVSATNELVGIVQYVNGGTGSSAPPTAGGVAYGAGTQINVSAAGTAGWLLNSTGASAPNWINPGTLNVASAASANALNGVLPIANGGTGSSATPANGGIAYGAPGQILFNATGTNGYLLYSGAGGAPGWVNPSALNVNSATSAATANSVLASNISGVVPVSSGGTNSIAVPINGGVAYGTGAGGYAFTNAGTSGQVLVSSGAAAPAWSSTVTPPSTTSILKGNGGGGFATYAGGSCAANSAVTLVGADGALTCNTHTLGGSPTNGGAVYGTGTALAITAAGTAGQVLTSNGAAAPSWSAAVATPPRVSLSSDFTTTNTTGAAITGLSWTPPSMANSSCFCVFKIKSSATTLGGKFQVLGGGGNLATGVAEYKWMSALGTSPSTPGTQATLSVDLTSSTMPFAGPTTGFTTYSFFYLRGQMTNGTVPGPWQVWGGPSSAGTLTVAAGSYCDYW